MILAFNPEFLNRIDDIIVFHPLEMTHIEGIVAMQLDRVRRMLDAQKITATFEKSLIEHIADVGFDPEFGARPLKRAIQKEVENELSHKILSGDVKEGDEITVGFSKGKVDVK